MTTPKVYLVLEYAKWDAILPNLQSYLDERLTQLFIYERAQTTTQTAAKSPQELSEPPPTATLGVSIVLADDAFVQDLNLRFRGKDKPTNVLSFPSDEEDYIGDIILAFETVDAEAHAQNKSFIDHFTHLIFHGTLHLLGYDHIEEAEAVEMETTEIALLKNLGIANPYEES